MDTSSPNRQHHTVTASMLVPLQTKAKKAYRTSPVRHLGQEDARQHNESNEDLRQPAGQHAEHEENESPRSFRTFSWKQAVISLLCIFILTPLIGYAGLTAAGSIWIDQAKLDALYASVNKDGVSPDGFPVIRVEHMPTYVSDSLLAIEDHRFYLHPGFDPIGLGRSVWVDLREGHKAQGGSTLTMQLARNLFLTQEKLFSRKLKEIAIAANMEWRYSKQDILNMYLNRVYFGHGKYGVEAAAQFYFHKTTALYGEQPTINLAESAMLMGLLKAPERYSPIKHPEKAKARQEVVLHRMHQLGWISQAELNEALKTPILVSSGSMGAASAAA
ncbi:MAG: transglycosylase domain-containing protein [Paenibacillus sp.]|nr:transglycosylase domain-containing protein [Paenibacillus sp.]